MNRLLFFFCLLCTTSYAQMARLDTVTFYVSHDDTCNLYIVSKSVIGSGCYKINTAVDSDSSNIYVSLCYGGTPVPSVCVNYDTVCLKVADGVEYNVKVIVSLAYGGSSCDSVLDSDTKSSRFYFGAVGFAEIGGEALALFPNPAGSMLTGRLPHSHDREYSCRIYSVHGAEVFRSVLGHSDFSLDVSGLPSGIYYLAIYDNQQRYVKKFVKQ